MHDVARAFRKGTYSPQELPTPDGLIRRHHNGNAPNAIMRRAAPIVYFAALAACFAAFFAFFSLAESLGLLVFAFFI